MKDLEDEEELERQESCFSSRDLAQTMHSLAALRAASVNLPSRTINFFSELFFNFAEKKERKKCPKFPRFSHFLLLAVEIRRRLRC